MRGTKQSPISRVTLYSIEIASFLAMTRFFSIKPSTFTPLLVLSPTTYYHRPSSRMLVTTPTLARKTKTRKAPIYWGFSCFRKKR
nr:MAG TPA: hypothetical protein [Caudoviricetes sp.]